MPRIRSIHPEACDSEKLAALSDSAERTFFRLLTFADDDGRGEDRPKLLAAKLYPLVDGKDAVTVDADLEEIAAVGLLVRYAVDGKRFYAIPTFKDWQSPRHPRPSRYPEPPNDGPTVTAERGTVTAERGKAPAGVGVGSGVGEGSGSGVGEGGADAADADAPDPVEEQFAEFWDQYPRHAKNGKPGGGGDRKPTLRRWRSLSKAKREQALAAVGNYRGWCESAEGEWPKHAETWLNAESWEGWKTPATPTANRGSPGAVQPPERDANYADGWSRKATA